MNLPAGAARTIARARKLTGQSEAVAAALRSPQHLRTLRRVAGYTMVPTLVGIDNLELVARYGTVPGDIVECGTWRGGMSAAMAMTSPAHHFSLFDSFEGLPEVTEADGESARKWQTDERTHDNCSATEADARAAMSLSGHTDFELHRGWFEATVPTWAERKHPISVLRLDGDWYESTKVCLDHLAPLVVPGGVIIIDDYGVWEGCSKAVHDYLAEHSSPWTIATTRHGVAYIAV